MTADIDDCIFENSEVGLLADQASDVTVANSTFDGNATGICCVDEANIAISNNTVKNGAVGIACYDSANATITGNTIRDNLGGLVCDDASPIVESNDIIYNATCVLTDNNADPDVGHYSGGSSAGNNEIHHGSTYNFANLTGGLTVMAENNYWQYCPPKAAKLSGSIDTNPALCSPPAVADRPTAGNLPTVYALNQNYPNPFNPVTTIKYQIPPPGGMVRISIYNVRGQLVRTLVNGVKQPGYYAESWAGINNRGRPVASGVYFMQMRASRFVQTRKLVLLK